MKKSIMWLLVCVFVVFGVRAQSESYCDLTDRRCISEVTIVPKLNRIPLTLATRCYITLARNTEIGIHFKPKSVHYYLADECRKKFGYQAFVGGTVMGTVDIPHLFTLNFLPEFNAEKEGVRFLKNISFEISKDNKASSTVVLYCMLSGASDLRTVEFEPTAGAQTNLAKVCQDAFGESATLDRAVFGVGQLKDLFTAYFW